MNIEWYSPKIGAPVVSVADYGLTLSLGAVVILGRPTHIKLGYNNEKNALVIAACLPNDEDGIDISGLLKETYLRIAKRDYIKFLKSRMNNDKIIGKIAKKYIAKWSEENRALIVFLDDFAEPNTKNENEGIGF